MLTPALALSLPLRVGSAAAPVIEWDAPPNCPSERAVRRRIRQALRDAPPGPARTVQARVIQHEGRPLRLDIAVSGAGLDPSIRPSEESDACAELADYFVLYVDELWRGEAHYPTRPARRRLSPPEFILRTTGAVAYSGAIRAVIGRGYVFAVLDWRYARMELGVSGDGSIHPGWGSLHLHLRGCGKLRRGSLDFHLCGGGAAGPAGRVRGDSKWSLELDVTLAMTWWFHRHVGLWVGSVAAFQPIMTRDLRQLPPQSEDSNTCVGIHCIHDPLAWFVLGGSVGLEFRFGR